MGPLKMAIRTRTSTMQYSEKDFTICIMTKRITFVFFFFFNVSVRHLQ